MLGIQAAGDDRRAVAAYARLLVAALLRHASDHDFLLYGHDEHPRDAILSAPGATFVRTNFGRFPGETTPTARLEWLAEANPDRLDWLVVLDPFAPALGLGPPARPLAGTRLAAVVADLTPFVLPERDLTARSGAGRDCRALGATRHYDAPRLPRATTQNSPL